MPSNDGVLWLREEHSDRGKYEKRAFNLLDSSVLNFIYFSKSLNFLKFLGKLEQGMSTNLAIQMMMIAKFSTPYVKSLQINVISQQRIRNGTYQKNQLIICVFVGTYPVYVVVITC